MEGRSRPHTSPSNFPITANGRLNRACRLYSYRSASIGLSDAALRAG